MDELSTIKIARTKIQIKDTMKIAIAGTGYVGISNAVLLAQHNEVVTIGARTCNE